MRLLDIQSSTQARSLALALATPAITVRLIVVCRFTLASLSAVIKTTELSLACLAISATSVDDKVEVDEVAEEPESKGGVEATTSPPPSTRSFRSTASGMLWGSTSKGPTKTNLRPWKTPGSCKNKRRGWRYLDGMKNEGKR